LYIALAFPRTAQAYANACYATNAKMIPNESIRVSDCAGLGFFGQLISPRYGWFAGAILAVPVSVLLPIGSFKQALRDAWKKRRDRG
jgi:hypothetical protein